MNPIWSGAISFGLIHIPVKLYSAAKDRSLKFQYRRKKDLSPIGYVKISKDDGEEVPKSQIVKGYEYQKGEFVILSDEDFKQAAIETSSTIDIEEFVKENEIDPIYYEKPYYLAPDHKSDKVYQLLLKAMKKSKKVGIGKFVLRTKEHPIALKASGDLLIINTLRTADEIKEPDEQLTPKKTKLNEKEINMAVKLIDKMEGKFDPKKFEDEYTKNLEKIINAKAKGKKMQYKKAAAPKATTVPDLMKTLEASLKNSDTSKTKKTSKPTKVHKVTIHKHKKTKSKRRAAR